MKKILTLLLAAALTLALCAGAAAVDESQSYEFDLTANGEHEIRVQPGDTVTLTLTLRRTDGGEGVSMLAMQDEITYDGAFFELDDGGAMTAPGVQTNDLGLRDGHRAYYMNYLALTGAVDWETETMVGIVRLRVTGQSGSSVIENRNCAVSLPDGSDSNAVSVQNVTVIVSEDCTVKYETGEGTETPDSTVKYGEKLPEPTPPTREGYTFAGWYGDLDRLNPWDFDTPVTGNMTLYASWTEGEAETQSPAPEEKNDSGTWLIIAAAAVAAAVAVAVVMTAAKKRKK